MTVFSNRIRMVVAAAVFCGVGLASGILHAGNAHAMPAGAGNDGPIDFGNDTNRWALDGECDDPRFEGEGMALFLLDEDRYTDATDCRRLFEQGSIRLVETGTDAPSTPVTSGDLNADDEMISDQQTASSATYGDVYHFDGVAGQEVVLDLRSADFDTFLILHTPGRIHYENDDHQSDTSRSRLVLTLEETGKYEVIVTSYYAGETGSYTLSIDTRNAGGSR